MSENSDNSLWLNAWHDPLSNIKTSSPNMRFADLNGDGESKLCICDMDKKIKIYQGTQLSAEYALLDTPIAMCVTYTDNTSHIPSLAVAAGSHVFIYRQLRPYRKWTCPTVDVASIETDIWQELRNGAISSADAVRALTEAREKGTALTARSSELLTLADEKRSAFIQAFGKDSKYAQHTLITCMETLKNESGDNAAASHLVLGTESCEIIILPPDPVTSTYLQKIKLPSVPVLISTTGQFLVEWRITVVCRNGKMYSIKNGDSRGTAVVSGSVVELGSQAVSLTKHEKSVWVATMDRFVSCYSHRGKCIKRLAMPQDVTEILVVSVKKAKVSHLLLVALANGDIRMYRDATLIHSFTLDAPVLGMRFGSYGREDNSLIVVHGRGALTVKIWRRAAEVESLNIQAGPPPEQDIPIPVPKKTKLYLEQAQREREQAPDIHRSFQRDLCRLRLETAKAYVKTLTSAEMVRFDLMLTSSFPPCSSSGLRRVHLAGTYLCLAGSRLPTATQRHYDDCSFLALSERTDTVPISIMLLTLFVSRRWSHPHPLSIL